MILTDEQMKRIVREHRPDFTNWSPVSEPYKVAQAEHEATLKDVFEKIARHLDIPIPTVERWYKGESKPHPKVIDALAGKLPT